METIKISDMEIKVQPPFKRIRWSEVEDGQLVYSAGTHKGEFVAYGPYQVKSKRGRLLKVPSGRTKGFMEPFEMLLIKN